MRPTEKDVYVCACSLTKQRKRNEERLAIDQIA